MTSGKSQQNGSTTGPWTIVTLSPLETRLLGERLAPLLQAGDVICLEGNLGSGKTCFAQGVAQGLGVRSPVTSPTFIIVSQYALLRQAEHLYHIDLYRVRAAAEAQAIGIEDFLYGDGIALIEWPDSIDSLLPADRLTITFRYIRDSSREICFQPAGARWESIVTELRRSKVTN